MQCESTRGTAGAMSGGSSDEPLPGAIQDAVAGAIEGGATMDEIVARVRPRDEPSRAAPRLFAVRRGPLGRAHGQPDLPAARG